MDLIDEENGSQAEAGGLLGLDHHLLDLPDAAEHGGKLDEAGPGDMRDDLGERRLAYARWTPQDHGGGIVLIDGQTQRLAIGEQMGLTHELIERSGAHPFRKRGVSVGAGPGGGKRSEVKETHRLAPTRARCRSAS